MMRALTILLSTVVVALAANGCKTACEDLSPRVEVAFTLAQTIQPERVALIRALVSLNGGAAVARDLTSLEAGLSGDRRFVVIFDQAVQQQATLDVTLSALDASQVVLGRGRLDTSASLRADGCNFISLTIGPLAAPLDGGADLPAADSPADGPADGPVADGGSTCANGWCAVPAGTFSMGSASSPCAGSLPFENAHQVTLTRPFEIMITEVTQQAFEKVMGYNPSVHSTCKGCPVDKVNWHQAAAYCNALSAQKKLSSCYACIGNRKAVTCPQAPMYQDDKLYQCPGYRLPTEAEWEYAYRAGTTTAFYSGTFSTCADDNPNADQLGWYLHNASDETHLPCLKQTNPWGLCDMGGNVFEWVNDNYSGTLGFAPVTDPAGPQGLPSKVLRGGAYDSPAKSLRAAARWFLEPNVGYYGNLGFRCVRSILP
jgi:formylglycine-generating enzyme required for sulfatase activity